MDCLGDEIARGIRSTAEAATEKRGVDRHLLGIQARHLRRRGLVDSLELGPGPDLALISGELDGAVERLHRRVREVGNLVFGFQLRRYRSHRRSDIARGSSPRPGRAAQSAKL